MREAEAAIPGLPAADHARAGFAVQVRLAENLLKAGKRAEAAELAVAAHARYRGDADAYGGSHRILLALLLWDALPEESWFAELRAEADWLLDQARLQQELARAGYLHVPLRLLGCALRRARGEAGLALQAQQKLARELLADPDADPVWKRKCLGELAWQFLVRRDWDRAKLWLDELPADQTRYAHALIALHVGDFATAEREGLRLAEGEPLPHGGRRDGDPRFYVLVGDARERQGRYADARRDYERALAVARAPLDVAEANNGIGDCALGLDEPDAAAASYATARRAAERIPAVLERATACAETAKDLGRVALARGDRSAARVEFRQAIELLEQGRATIPLNAYGGAWLDAYFLEAVDGMLAAAGNDGEELWRALAATEFGRARVLLDWATHPPALQQGEALRQAAGALIRGDRPLLRIELDSLREGGVAIPPEQRVRPLDAAALRAQVLGEAGTLFCSYWLGGQELWLLVAEGGSTRLRCHRLGPRRERLAELGAAFLAVCDPTQSPDAALAAAARAFLPEAEHAALGTSQRIVLCADAAIARLPFEALPLEGVPLGVRVPVERAPSLTLRAQLAGRRGAGGALVLDSIPLSDALAQELELAPIRFGEEEGGRIAAAHDARRRSGAAAGLVPLREELARAPAGIVHLQAHAVTSDPNPSAALLLLADGVADMPQLAQVPFAGALVVLSACQSAGGRVRAGEGTLGLLCGVFGGGARGAVAALYDVNQQATADLMTQFHTRLAAGDDPAEAMRAARGVLAASPQYAHPHYWAGFGVYAPPQPGQDSPWIWVLAGCGSLLLLLLPFVAGLNPRAARRRSSPVPAERR